MTSSLTAFSKTEKCRFTCTEERFIPQITVDEAKNFQQNDEIFKHEYQLTETMRNEELEQQELWERLDEIDETVVKIKDDIEENKLKIEK